MSGVKTTKEYEIHYYEIDYRKKLLVTSLIDFLGDMASYQSELLGVGMEYLKENNLAWVLYKWDIVVDRYPVYGEKINITTIPYSFKKFYGSRKFEVKDEEGKIIATANSLWILVNIEKKRPVRVSQDIMAVYGIDGEDDPVADIKDIEKLSKHDYEKIFNVRYSDIDTNKHVNNAKYVSWAIEVIPMEIILNYSLKRIVVTYEKETKYGDVIKSITEIQKADDSVLCLHKIEDGEGKEVTVLETQWDRNE
jgi:medium-chain acyl-[acyl-carrier-protein] hydrolase